MTKREADDRRLEEAVADKPRHIRTGLPALFYAAFCALFSAVALMGLFLGASMPAPFGELLAGGEPIMRGALLGVIVEVLRGSIAAPDLGAGLLGKLPLFLYAAVFLVMFSVLASLLLTVFAFLRPQHAKRLCIGNGILVAAAYGLPSLGCLLMQAMLLERFGWQELDLPTAITALSAALLLIGLACCLRRGRGVLNALLLLVTLVGVFTFSYPGTPILADLNAAFSAEGGASSLRMFLVLVLLSLALNLALSLARLFADDSFLLDAARNGVWLLFSLLLVVFYMRSGIGIVDFFMEQPLPALALVLPPVAALALSAFGASLYGGKKRRARRRSSAPLPAEEQA